MTDILSDEKKIEYSKNRLFGKNISINDINHIRLLNGRLPSEVVDIIRTEEVVNQNNPREPIFCKENELLIPQYSSIERGLRYQKMIEYLYELTDHKFNIDISERDGNFRSSDIWYNNFAYNHAVGLFVPTKDYEDRRIFQKYIINSDIKDIIIGPLDTVAKKADKILEVSDKEYLETQLVEIGGKKVLNLGYVYGSQGNIILEKILREYANVFGGENVKDNEINIYVYGRIGGLTNQNINDLMIPTEVTNWSDLRKNPNSEKSTTIENILAEKDNHCKILNVSSVIDQTHEQLNLAREKDCQGVEMELSFFNRAIEEASQRYDGLISPNIGFVGYVSDKPSEGDTLADEKNLNEGKEKSVDLIKKNILKR